MELNVNDIQPMAVEVLQDDDTGRVIGFKIGENYLSRAEAAGVAFMLLTAHGVGWHETEDGAIPKEAGEVLSRLFEMHQPVDPDQHKWLQVAELGEDRRVVN